MASTEIWQWSAAETARAIRAGETTAQAVMEAHVARLAVANPSINAVVVDLSEAALATARVADQAQAKGAALGPLHGVPVTLKINIDLEGQANSNGVPGLSRLIAPSDSPVAANLKAAGAIVLGMTNTPEFSFRAFTDNPLYGLTRNPWDMERTSGGSSGGAAASVASGIGAIAHGNDIGGSLRIPASWCGVATIKPTLGRVPAFNASAPAERPPMAQLMSVQGPLAREVADVRLGLEAMSRRDPRDPWWVPAPLTGPPVAKPFKVAVAKIPGDMTTDAEVMARIAEAADHLAAAGYAVSEVEIPDIGAAWRLWCDLIFSEAVTLQMGQMRELGSPDFHHAFGAMVEMATILDLEGYMKAMAMRARLLRDWLAFLEDWPVILAPMSVQRTPLANADLAAVAAVQHLFWNDLRFTSAISVLGLPSAVVCAGLAYGCPVGVQLIASRYREDLALDAAGAIEARVGVIAQQLWTR